MNPLHLSSHRFFLRAFIVLVSVATLALGGLFLLPANAAGVVGTGTPGSCTEAALLAAMSGGGLVTFNCGALPVVITVATAGGIVPPPNTTLNGDGLVTLDANHATRLFHLVAGRSLTLTNITLRNGNVTGFNSGGCILTDGGSSLALDNAVVATCSAFAGGDIYNLGTALLNRSTLSGGSALGGGGIYNLGTATLYDSVVGGSSAVNGGGIANDSGATLMLFGTLVRGNSALSASGKGAGIYNSLGAITLIVSTVSGNTADATGADGGGVYNYGAATLNSSTVSGNSASAGGGIYNDSFFTTTLSYSTVSGNNANTGGGIYNAANLFADNSTISGNSASSGGGLFNSGTAKLVNATFSGNEAFYGGGVYSQLSTHLRNVTLSNNTASQGGALYMVSPAVLTNTVLAYSASGGNCHGTVGSSKYSLSSDVTCALAGWLERPNPNGVDPLLTGLGNYGGSTLVHMLKGGSPAIDGVIGSDAPISDQRGVARPQGGGFDIGAVERILGETTLAPRLYLPVLRR